MDHIVNAHCSHVDLSCGLLPSIVGKGTQSGALLIADCWGSLCCLFCFICLCLLLGMLTLNSHAHCALSFSLCFIHCALFTVLYSLCVIHCALFTVLYSLCFIHCALFTVLYSLCVIHCALFTVLYSLCVIHCALLTVLDSLCFIYCALFIVRYSLCVIHCALFTLRYSLWQPLWLTYLSTDVFCSVWRGERCVARTSSPSC